MKKALWKSQNACWHFVDGLRIDGCHDNLTGDVTRLLTGNVTGLTGDVDDCELSDADRVAGVNVTDLCDYKS